jgi:Trypsin-like peptidase domain/Gram-negative bacterial TonB protein C-terminal
MTAIQLILAITLAAISPHLPITSVGEEHLQNPGQPLEQFLAAPTHFDAALCQIVYQVDRSPSPQGYRYLFYGNGFFINDQGYVLTAAHVLKALNGGQPYLLLRATAGSSQFVEASVVAIDHDHDVALLRATPNPFQGGYRVSFLSLAADDPVTGQTALAEALHPLNPRYSYSAEPIIEEKSGGTLLSFESAQLEGARVDTELLVFSHPVQPGQSGAAVISPNSQAAIGLVEGQWLRGALTALAAAKHRAANDAPDWGSKDEVSAVPSVVIPIHYAIALLQQKGIEWHAVMKSPQSGQGFASEPTVAVPLSLVPATYPSQSFFGAEVLLDALVDSAGTLSDVRVVQGEGQFLENALAAVRTWTFIIPHSAGQQTGRVAIIFDFPQPYIPPRTATEHHYDKLRSAELKDTAPFPLITDEPAYPEEATAKAGSVLIYAQVDRTGQLGSTQVVRGVGPLVRVTLAALRNWKFMPASQHGTAIDSAAIIVVTFRQPLVVGRARN